MARTYTLSIGDRVVEAKVSDNDAALEVTIDGALHWVLFDPIDDDGRLFSMLVDGQSYEVYAHGGGGGGGGAYQLLVANEPFDVQVERGHARERPIQLAAAAGPRLVRSPMTGVVSSVEVSVGQVVERGTVLVILESMKMNNELRAETEGTIEEIAVAAGARVERGDLLLRVSSR